MSSTTASNGVLAMVSSALSPSSSTFAAKPSDLSALLMNAAVFLLSSTTSTRMRSISSSVRGCISPAYDFLNFHGRDFVFRRVCDPVSFDAGDAVQKNVCGVERGKQFPRFHGRTNPHGQ